DDRVAGLSLLVLASMPSLHLLASWAYTDFTLAYFCLAVLFSLTGWRRAQGRTALPWLLLAASNAGMAMGVKYTSFILPISAVLLLFWWGRHQLRRAWRPVLLFSLVALLIASPWYLRNLFQTGNPVYPFVFGGQNWDTFRAAMYADAGTGIGWDAVEILLLPFNATLGHRDANFYDGRLGPLFLLLAPLTLWVLWDAPRRPAAQRQTLFVITVFSGLSLLIWVLGVVTSSALWQTRLLFPALLPLALPTALGFLVATRLDTSHLRLSFILNFAVLAVVSLTLIDAGIGVIRRNPLAYATGLETRAAYLGRVQPAHAEGMALLDQTPPDAKIYFLYEPRTYYAARLSQPDPILDNFLHDLYLYQDAAGVLQAWRAQGYTHLLLYQNGLDFMIENRPDLYPLEDQEVIAQVLRALDWQASSSSQAYQLYRLPAK
ncbi:MAG: hypothetical protein JW862_04185, partial [Anaerolineales bacterium]|nr:hypothetical protein [Anaerolineales bacterium]